MSVRESVHQLIDSLPEDQLSEVLDYLRELNDSDELEQPSRSAIAARIDEGYAAAQRGELIDSDQVREQINQRKSFWRNDHGRG